VNELNQIVLFGHSKKIKFENHIKELKHLLEKYQDDLEKMRNEKDY
jgi:hypothetical protein